MSIYKVLYGIFKLTKINIVQKTGLRDLFTPSDLIVMR